MSGGIDIDDLMQRIRAEVDRRKRGAALPAGGSGAAPIQLPRAPSLKSQLAVKDSYAIEEFLNLDAEDLVDSAYRVLLRRSADPAGRLHYLAALREGRLSKAEVVGRLRYSPEGRARRVRVRGLLPQLAVRSMYRMPVIGYLTAWLNFLVRLPVVVRNFERFESYSRDQMRQLSETSTRLAEESERGFRGGSEAVDALVRQAASREMVDTALARLDVMENDHRELAVLRDTIDRLARHLSAEMDAIRADSREIATLPRLREELDRALALGAELQVALAAKIEAPRFEELNARVVLVEQQKADQSNLARLEERLGVVAGAQLDQAALDARLARIEERQGTVSWIAERVATLTETKADRTLVEVGRVELEGRIAGMADKDAVGRLERAIDALRLAVRQRANAPVTIDPVSGEAATTVATQPTDIDLATLYLDLENAFRGTREQVRERAESYLPRVAAVQAGTEAAPVVDLGCGRGEWLELLRDRGLVARGVDLNPLFVDACREQGLEVEHGDAIAWLRRQPDHSIGAITAFHLVEHLPLETLLALLDEARRVLKPGGLVMLETPNPENLSVGACNFYLDPTHRNPVPPLLLQFLVANRGFEEPEIVRLAEHRVFDPLRMIDASVPGAAEMNPVIALVRQAYYSAPDYAVVARTP